MLGLIDRDPLLVERRQRNVDDHVIDIENPSNDDDITRISNQENDGLSSSQPLISGFWTSFGLWFTVSQIAVSAVVLSLSVHEKPEIIMLIWVIGHVVGCVASLPLLYWCYLPSNPLIQRRRLQRNEGTYTVFDDLMIRLLVPLGFFFAVWFVAGGIWVLTSYSSIPDSAIAYRLSLAYLIMSSSGYAMPFMIAIMLNCVMPFIVPDLRQVENRIHAASEESINTLPTHKFNSKGNAVGSSAETHSEGVEEGIAADGEDSLCSICLASYVDKDLLRELPCSHLFHSGCVDRWLRINASCPLCKAAVV